MKPLRKARIAVVGAGAVGAYYGGMLARAGFDVSFLLRSDLGAVRERGLIVHSGGERWRFPVQAAASAGEIGAVDLVLIALKATANPVLEELLPPLMGEQTVLLTLQNGLGNDEFLAERWGAERVLGGLCFVCLNRINAGEILHVDHGSITIGDFTAGRMDRAEALAGALREAGLVSAAVENLQTERWRKLTWNVPFNGLSIAAGGATVADILADEALRTEALALIEEVRLAAGALGHPISEEYGAFQIERSWSMGPYRPSSLIDWELGRPVEVEAIWGEALRRGRAAGVDLPRLGLLYSLLRRLGGGRQGV